MASWGHYRRLMGITARLVLSGRLRNALAAKRHNPLFPYGADNRHVLQQRVRVNLADLQDGHYGSSPVPVWRFAGGSEASGAEDAPSWDGAQEGWVLWVEPEAALAPGFVEWLAHQEYRSARPLYFDSIASNGPVFRPSFSPTLLRHSHYLGEVLAVPAPIFGKYVAEHGGGGMEGFTRWTGDLHISWRHEGKLMYRTRLPAPLWHARLESVPPKVWTPVKRVAAIIPSQTPDLIGRVLGGLCGSSWMSWGVALEVIVVANGVHSRQVAERAGSFHNVKVLVSQDVFNWARVNNWAAANCDSDWLLFLNDDLELDRGDWLPWLVSELDDEDVGVVGGLLCYPNGDIQHAGIAMPKHGVLVHRFQFLRNETEGYMGLLRLPHEVLAVTGAFMLTRRDLFDSLGGFDERYRLAYNDVDYCLRAWQRGWRVIFTPKAQAVHHESLSRGRQGEAAEVTREFNERWGQTQDPFIPLGLTRWFGLPYIREPGLDI